MTFNLVEFITHLRSAVGRVRASHILASIATDEYKTRADFPELTLRIFDVEVENGDEQSRTFYEPGWCCSTPARFH